MFERVFKVRASGAVQGLQPTDGNPIVRSVSEPTALFSSDHAYRCLTVVYRRFLFAGGGGGGSVGGVGGGVRVNGGSSCWWRRWWLW